MTMSLLGAEPVIQYVGISGWLLYDVVVVLLGNRPCDFVLFGNLLRARFRSNVVNFFRFRYNFVPNVDG